MFFCEVEPYDNGVKDNNTQIDFKTRFALTVLATLAIAVIGNFSADKKSDTSQVQPVTVSAELKAN